ncbi:MAG: hypothetical protein C4326_13545 [Ignavibacteria bacterium]
MQARTLIPAQVAKCKFSAEKTESRQVILPANEKHNPHVGMRRVGFFFFQGKGCPSMINGPPEISAMQFLTVDTPFSSLGIQASALTKKLILWSKHLRRLYDCMLI